MPPTVVAPDREIADPLNALRGSLRRYVVVDGLLAAGLIVVAWFWLGLALDYGIFRLTGFDWVMDAPKWLRAVALIGLGVLLLATLVMRLVLKLNRTYSDASLALLLEKRFPEQLGDKLITAVEMADVERAERQGFSGEMVRETIAEAKRRVEGLPVDSVFNWGRLRSKGILIGVAAIGTLLVVYAGSALWTGSGSANRFGGAFGDVALTWGERNLLLSNVPWPRRAHVELVGFSGDELRIGKDAPPPKVTARAYKWVIADRTESFGWRPLKWNDLTERVLGFAPPTLPGTTLADDAEANADAKKVFDKLESLVARRGLSRTIRKLVVPADLTLTYAGGKTRGSLSLTAEPGNIFSGEIAGLKESVRFVVRGEDFATRPRTITLVPPPMLIKLSQQESVPAYLYHPPAVGTGFDSLKGQYQLLPERDLSLTGDKTTHSVRAGSELVLRGTSEKPLAKVVVRPKLGTLPGQAKPDDVLELAAEGAGRDQFTFAFRGADRLTKTVEFEFVLTDDDNVTAKRTVVLQVTEDQPPQVELAVDVLRKVGNSYLVTPAVMVPFLADSKVRDDTGLSKVEFVLTYSQVESSLFLGVQAQYLAGIFAPVPVPGGLPAAIVPAGNAALAQRLIRTEQKTIAVVPVGRFMESFATLGADTPAVLASKLTKPADEARVVREVKFQNPQTDVLDLRAAIPSLASSDPSGVQPRYRVEVALVATDANVESGPKIGQNLDPIRLLVVSEADLLMELSKDEEALIGKVDEVLRKLRDAQTKFTQTADRLLSPAPPPDVILSASVRAQDIAQDVAKAQDTTAGVLTEYRRLYREAEVNRINETLLRRYQTEIITPIQAVLDGPFVSAVQAHVPFTTALAENRRPADEEIAVDRAALTELIRQMTAVRERLGEVLSLSKLRDTAGMILNRQKLLGEMLKRLARAEVEKLGTPVITVGPVVELAKGEKKVIRHPLAWGTFSGDSYRVKLSARPAGGVKLPGEILVPDDKDEVQYEVVAGDTPGPVTVTLTPSAGPAVEVKFVVK